MHYDPSDLGLICLVQKRKIRCFWILWDLRIQSYIFVKERTLKIVKFRTSNERLVKSECDVKY